jgi:ABC-type antimicrobial peptide transport system permease subunit
MAATVAQRSREIGLRLALGAQHHEVLIMILLQGMKLTAIGVGLGLACALAMGQSLSSMLFDVKPSDPTTLTCISILLGLVALLACWLPARRAANVDPMEALRYE